MPTLTFTRRQAWVATAAVAALLAGGLTLYLALRPGPVTIAGSVTLATADSEYLGVDRCSGQGGYSDLRGGAQVVVADGAGTVLAVGRLAPGEWSIHTGCVLAFTVTAPESGVYTLTIANRPPLRYTRDEVRQPLRLSIGG